MTADTALLPRVDEPAEAVSTPITGTWELDLSRCALEVSAAPFGLTVWRARLRPLAARLVFPERDPLGGVAEGSYIAVSAAVASRAAYANLPMTRDWFLPAVPGSDRIRIEGNALPRAVAAGDTFHALARIRTDEDLWWSALAIRFTPVDAERAVVAMSGVVPRRKDAPFARTPIKIDAAAEFVRCG